jgi:hypothetical protein
VGGRRHRAVEVHVRSRGGGEVVGVPRRAASSAALVSAARRNSNSCPTSWDPAPSAGTRNTLPSGVSETYTPDPLRDTSTPSARSWEMASRTTVRLTDISLARLPSGGRREERGKFPLPISRRMASTTWSTSEAGRFTAWRARGVGPCMAHSLSGCSMAFKPSLLLRESTWKLRCVMAAPFASPAGS